MKFYGLLLVVVVFAGCAGVREKAHTPKPQFVVEPVFLDFPPVEEEYPEEEDKYPDIYPYHNDISVRSPEELGISIH